MQHMFFRLCCITIVAVWLALSILTTRIAAQPQILLSDLLEPQHRHSVKVLHLPALSLLSVWCLSVPQSVFATPHIPEYCHVSDVVCHDACLQRNAFTPSRDIF